MIPVLLGSSWEFFPSLDQEDAGVADVSTPELTQTTGSDRATHMQTTPQLGERCMRTANL